MRALASKLFDIRSIILRTNVFPLSVLPTIGLLISTFASAICVIFLGRGIKAWVDSTNSSVSTDFGYLQIIYIAQVIVLAISSGARIYFSTLVGDHIGANLRISVYNSIIMRPLNYFERSSTGNLLTLLTSDVTTIQQGLRSAISPFVRNFTVLMGAGLMLLITSLQLSLIALLFIPLLFVLLLLLSEQQRSLSLSLYDGIGALASRASEVFQGIATVKASNQEGFELLRFTTSVATINLINRKLAGRRAFLLFLITFLGLLLFGLLLWVGHRRIVAGSMSPGTFSSFTFFLLLVGGSASTLGNLWSSIMDTAAAFERIMVHFEDRAAKSNVGCTLPTESPSPKSVQFKQVSFRYAARSERWALDSVSFNVSAGEVVALVGGSGAGKTTIARLLLGFEFPDRGQILIDDKDTSKLTLERLRSWIAVVPQDPFIFSDTLKANILYGNPHATDAEVAAATAAAAVDLFIQDLPAGTDTFIGERGTSLSGGQRQRTAIARALLRKAPILLLDEPTNSLDAWTQAVVHQTIAKSRGVRTTLVIAHNPATIRMADRVVVLHRGRVLAEGFHDELMLTSKIYRTLIQTDYEK
jgi:ATP-binding cassette subfamily B protein